MGDASCVSFDLTWALSLGARTSIWVSKTSIWVPKRNDFENILADGLIKRATYMLDEIASKTMLFKTMLK